MLLINFFLRTCHFHITFPHFYENDTFIKAGWGRGRGVLHIYQRGSYQWSYSTISAQHGGLHHQQQWQKDGWGSWELTPLTQPNLSWFTPLTPNLIVRWEKTVNTDLKNPAGRNCTPQPLRRGRKGWAKVYTLSEFMLVLASRAT